MGKTKKILVAFVVAIVTAFCFAGCNANTDELQRRIEELEAQLQARDEKIAQLEEELAEKSGTIYTLQEAYDRKLLTEEDIMHISYYKTGEVYKVEKVEDSQDWNKWQKVDFVPEEPLPELDAKTAELIKTAYYNKNIQFFKDHDGTIRYGKDILKIRFLGCYNGNYAVEVDSDEWSYGAADNICCVGGIAWTYSGPPVTVYSVN